MKAELTKRDRALMRAMLESLIEMHDQFKQFGDPVTRLGIELDNPWRNAIERANRTIHFAKRRLGECDWL